MNVVLAIIANGGWAIIVIDREGIFSFSLLILLKHFDDGLVHPFRVGSQGWCTLVHQNHAAGGENGSIMVGIFVSLCLVSQKPSEREYLVPARMDLGVKLF
jgi:hypothetical protein